LKEETSHGCKETLFEEVVQAGRLAKELLEEVVQEQIVPVLVP
jgi:hypothetical protein